MSKKNRQKDREKSMSEPENKSAEKAELPEFGKSEEVAKGFEEKSETGEAQSDNGSAIMNESAAGDESDVTASPINDGVAEKPITEKQKNKKIDTYIEFVLIFILGVLIGVALKTEAEKRITIGFDDYKMKIVRQDFDINKIQFEVAKKSVEESKAQEEGEIIEGEEVPQSEE